MCGKIINHSCLVLLFVTFFLSSTTLSQDSLSISVFEDSANVQTEDSLEVSSAADDTSSVQDSSDLDTAEIQTKQDSTGENAKDSLAAADSTTETSLDSVSAADSTYESLGMADSAAEDSLPALHTAEPPLTVQKTSSESVQREKTVTSNPTLDSFLDWVYDHIPHLVFILLCVVLILYTLFYFIRKKDSRRFLTTTRLSVFDKMVQRTCRYIESNFSDPQLTVESICRDLVTGEAYLEALFEKELGISIDEFIIQVRVNHLRMLMKEDPEITSDQITDLCGFKNMDDAEQAFRSITGVPLEQLKRSLREQSA